jgi:hypothetical protein
VVTAPDLRIERASRPGSSFSYGRGTQRVSRASDRCTAGVTTLNGRVEINANRRGGARVEEGSRLTVNGDTLISLNTSPRPGGGIANLDGEVFLNDDSDVLRNTAPIGGGIFNSDGGLMELNDTTRIARNVATDGPGGGVYNDGGIARIENSTHITANTPDNCFPSTIC